MTELPRFLTYKGIPVWRHIQVINWVSQVTSGILVVTLVIWFFTNIGNAIQDREIPYGFNFLSRAYQTPIGQHFIPYESSDTFLYAFGVAATNTLIVSIVGVILATALGIVVGAAMMSSTVAAYAKVMPWDFSATPGSRPLRISSRIADGILPINGAISLVNNPFLNQSQGGNYILQRWQRRGSFHHQRVGSGL